MVAVAPEPGEHLFHVGHRLLLSLLFSEENGRGESSPTVYHIRARERIVGLYREASLSQVLGRWKRLGDDEADLLKRARPTKKFVSRFAECRSSFLRRV